MWQVSQKRGFVEGVTLRRLNYIPAGTDWHGTFVLYPEPVRWQPRSRLIRVTAGVQLGARSRDLSYEIYVWPDEFASEPEFLAHVLQRVREGMEYKKNSRRGQQLRVLKVGFIVEEMHAEPGDANVTSNVKPRPE
jgi:hypothetical protein